SNTLTLVGPGGVEQHEATAFSSQATVVNFGLRPPPSPAPPPEARSCPAVGQPVNVASGNVFFDHVDASLSAFGRTVTFTRSYNSVNRGPGLSGIFGSGWTHEYERTLIPTPDNPAVLMMLRADGTAVYFEDDNGDSRYDPSVPFN